MTTFTRELRPCTIATVTHSLSPLVNIVMSSTDHLSTRRKYLTIVTIYDCHISLTFSATLHFPVLL